jgi:hypothetical protein
LIAYLLLWQHHHYHPFSLKSLIISTVGTFSHVYVCTRHINKDQYRFYALNYFDFTLLSSAKITFNMAITKIKSMTENYPEFRSAISITLVVTLAPRFKFWSPKTKFSRLGLHFSRQSWVLVQMIQVYCRI